MTKEQLNELRDILNEKLPDNGFILFIESPTEGGAHIVSNVCKDHFIKIMERIFKAAGELVNKNERT